MGSGSPEQVDSHRESSERIYVHVTCYSHIDSVIGNNSMLGIDLQGAEGGAWNDLLDAPTQHNQASGTRVHNAPGGPGGAGGKHESLKGFI